jgi:hypothetical protein
MKYKITNPKITFLFFLNFFLAIFLIIGGTIYWSQRAPSFSKSDQEQDMKKLMASLNQKNSKIFAEASKGMETVDILKLKEQNKEIMASYSRERIKRISELGDEVLAGIERNRFDLIKHWGDRKKISQAKFLKYLATHPYENKIKKNQENLELINKLKDTGFFKIYASEEDEMIEEALPILGDRRGKLKTSKSPYQLSLPQKLSDSIEFNKKDDNKDTRLALKLKDSSFQSPKAYDSKALYKDVKKGVDDLITAKADGVNQSFIIKDPTGMEVKDNAGYLTLSYDLDMSQLSAEEDQGAIILKDKDGKKQYIIAPPGVSGMEKKTSAEARFVLEEKEGNGQKNNPSSKVKDLLSSYLSIPSAQAGNLLFSEPKKQIPSYELKLEIKVNPQASFPVVVSYDLLPTLTGYFKDNEIVSQNQKAFLSGIDPKAVDPSKTENQSEYILSAFDSVLPSEAKEMLKKEEGSQSERIIPQASTDTFFSKIDLPEKEENKKEDKKEPFPDDPRNPENKKDDNQLAVKTTFQNLDDRISQEISLKTGQKVSSFKATLENSSGFSPSVYEGKDEDTKTYFGQNEIVTYSQSKQIENEKKIQLKENIYAKKPNNQNKSTYVWKLEGTGNSSITLKPQEDGSIQVVENMQVAGVDPKDKDRQKKIMDTVSEAMNSKIDGEKTIAIIEPLTYVTKDNIKKNIPYQITDDTITIEIEENEKSYPILIDPTFYWLEWMGGITGANEFINAVALGNDEEIYAGGYVNPTAVVSFQNAINVGGSYSGGGEGFVVELYDNAGSAPTISWLQWLGGTGNDYVYALAVSEDEIYAGGYVESDASFETALNTGGSYSGGKEGFVVELLDNAGSAPTMNWLQWLGGTGDDQVQALAVSDNEIYTGGYANSATSFETALNTGGSYNIGNNEGFVVEFYDNDGSAPTMNWLQWLGGTNHDYVYALAVSGDEIYAGGYASSATSFETALNTGGSYSGNTEGFVVELLDIGGSAPTINWLQWLGGTSYDYLRALAVFGDEIYAGGYTTVSITSWETALNTGGSYSGGQEGFVVELYDNAGSAPTMNWLQWLGGTGYDNVYALSVSGDEIYAGGYADSDASFEAALNTGGSYSGNYEGFAVELEDIAGSAPTINWLQWLGGTGTDSVYALAVSEDEIYAGGYAANATSWETALKTGGSYSGSNDGFVFELLDIGGSAPTINWLEWLGSSTYGGEYIYAVAVNRDNEIYVGGYAQSDLSFARSPSYIGGTNVGNGSNEGFVAEFQENANGNLAFNWLQWLGGTGGDHVYALAVSGDEIYAGGYATSDASWETALNTGGSYSGNDEGFVVELLDNAGSAPTLNWLQWLGGTSYDSVNALAISGDEIYAGGYAANATSWETALKTGGNYNSGSLEGFVIELLDNAGSAPTLNWLQWLGGTSYDSVWALGVSEDEIYAGGYTNSATSFETALNTGGTYSGGDEGFVVELLDNAGSAPTLNWLQWLGGTGIDYVNALVISGDEIYAGGNASSATSWETALNTGGSYSGSNEGFVVELLDNAGSAPTLNWLQWLGGTSYDYVNALAVSGDEIYAGGNAPSNDSFETALNTGGSFSGNGYDEGFVVELLDNAGSAPTINWLQWLGGTGLDYVRALAVDVGEIYAGGSAGSNASFETPSYTGGSYSGSTEAMLVKIHDDYESINNIRGSANFRGNANLR